MGWKGAVRSLNSELKRQARESDKRHRQEMKEREREHASDIVQDQESFLRDIISLHHECRADIDWESVESEIEPEEPNNTRPLTRVATKKLETYRPGIITRFLKIQKWRRRILEAKQKKAIVLDEKNHVRSQSEFERNKREWDKNQDLIKRMRSDGDALIEVLEEHLDVDDLSIGQNVEFEIYDDMNMDINLKVLPIEEIIPEEEYSLRQSGTLSTKKMAKGKALDLYQDHVCSALLRIARETLGVLPLHTVRANAVANRVNTKTGHLEDQIIISAIVPIDTLNRLNIHKIDPSDAMSNFVNNMKFKKTKGFESVDLVGLS